MCGCGLNEDCICTVKESKMAKYDHGGGCACGLNRECDCNSVVSGGYAKKAIDQIIVPTKDNSVNKVLKPNTPDAIPYKYNEDLIIADFQAYIDKTYSQHYNTDESLQAFDAWIALGDATPTFRNTALKYLWRYGKKNGNNKSDLMKTLHYTLLCLYNDHYKKGD